MAQSSSQPKRKPRENQYIFDLGVRGRKTGLTVADTGIRDENGLEPMDHLFSSPEKSTRKLNGSGRNANTTISSEEEMDLVESTLPDSDAVGRQRGSMRMPLPHSRSPKKTFLQSPARRNPSLGPLSSPSRGSIVVPRGPPESISVRRRLDFSNDNYDASTADSRVIGRSPQKRGVAKTSAFGRAGKGSQSESRQAPIQVDDGDDEYEDAQQQYYENEGDSYEIINDGNEEGPYQDVDSEPEPEPEPEPSQKAKGKGKANESATAEAAPKKGRGRRKRDSDLAEGKAESAPPAKRTRRSLDGINAAPNGKPSKAATSKGPKPKAAAAPKGRKPKATAKTNLAPISENDSPAVQRGPPIPRNNRGLIILRRETPMDSNGFKQTRSGRNSVRPVAYWKNERIEYSDDENEYYNGGKFLLPRIKGVVRADEVEERRPKRAYHKPSKGKKRAAPVESEDDDEMEAWEVDSGRLVGEIRVWDPEDQTGMNSEEVEEEIALSSTAIVTRDISGAGFKFAKTLTMPFFGSGVVDLPPGSVKKPKNSRKMQMMFFVFYGRVEVTVNESTFRIGKGGMWQVPRGNFYSIANDYDKPARIFFCQGCEVLEDATETTS